MKPALQKLWIFAAFLPTFAVCARNESSIRDIRRKLGEESVCDPNAKTKIGYKRYFDGLRSIYHGGADGTCIPVHMDCGWPSVQSHASKKLPTFVLSVGLEGAGHHLWTEILERPVFDCVWINGRHYHRDISDGVPRTTVTKLAQGMMEQLQMRLDSGKGACKSIYDAEDSFPTGAIRKAGRVFMRPDIVNLQKLDGKLFHVKYLIILRNVTVSRSTAYIIRRLVVFIF
jgi:hypothetical protein